MLILEVDAKFRFNLCVSSHQWPEASKVSLFLRHFLLSFYVSSCYNPIEIQFKLPRRFLPEKHH